MIRSAPLPRIRFALRRLSAPPSRMEPPGYSHTRCLAENFGRSVSGHVASISSTIGTMTVSAWCSVGKQNRTSCPSRASSSAVTMAVVVLPIRREHSEKYFLPLGVLARSRMSRWYGRSSRLDCLLRRHISAIASLRERVSTPSDSRTVDASETATGPSRNVASNPAQRRPHARTQRPTARTPPARP